MRVLLVGGGGREHALAWKLKHDHPSLDLLAAPGNPGIASLGRCVPLGTGDIDGLLSLARSERADLTIVGPEGPLAAGLVDRLHENSLAAFGPTQQAARIESSKAFAKQLMLEAGVPTAHAERHASVDGAKAAAQRLGAPVVIKASGLAAGKGVMICGSMVEAIDAINAVLRDRIFGDAGAEILVEEFMQGEELSVFGLTDGAAVLPMLPAQDHKRLLDGDRGPNTGGMGAYAPVSIASAQVLHDVEQHIFLPTLDALRRRGYPFRGLLYAGLMITTQGPRVVEFNCRFGDPETQAILPLLESDLLEIMTVIAKSGSLSREHLTWTRQHAATTVLAADGYPDSPRKGDLIRLPDSLDDVLIFHAGTALTPSGELVTAGGRVFAVTGLGPSLADARLRSRQGAERIDFPGKRFRTDIGWRELQRSARAS